MTLLETKFFLENLTGTILSIGRVIFFSSKTRLPVRHENKNCYILGNGPSLNSLIEKFSSELESSDLICVNHMGETNTYQDLKPDHYILNAPETWRDDVDDIHKIKGIKLFQTISDNTHWNINLFIPIHAKKFPNWQSILSKNPKIKIFFFNPTPVEGFSFINNILFNLRLGMPRPHNVLIPSIMLSCQMNYSKIYLLGADHSWLKDIYVAESNKVYLTQKHFYDEKTASPSTMDNIGKGHRKLHEILQKFVYSFRGYFQIKSFAESKGVKITNATPDSFIDAFPRI